MCIVRFPIIVAWFYWLKLVFFETEPNFFTLNQPTFIKSQSCPSSEPPVVWKSVIIRDLKQWNDICLICGLWSEDTSRWLHFNAQMGNTRSALSTRFTQQTPGLESALRVSSHLVSKETAPVSSSPWLVSEEVVVAVSSGSFSAPSSSCSRSLSEDRPPRTGALHTSRLERHSHMKWWALCLRVKQASSVLIMEWAWSISRSCGAVCVCRHLRLGVLRGGVFGFCRSWQSLSLMLIVSSGASRHTKIQLTGRGKKKHSDIKNSTFHFSFTVEETVCKHISLLISSGSRGWRWFLIWMQLRSWFSTVAVIFFLHTINFVNIFLLLKLWF